MIQGWFMNCVMVNRSVGSVFSRRRISCFAGEERECRAVAELLRASRPSSAQAPEFLTHRKSELITVYCFKSP